MSVTPTRDVAQVSAQAPTSDVAPLVSQRRLFASPRPMSVAAPTSSAPLNRPDQEAVFTPVSAGQLLPDMAQEIADVPAIPSSTRAASPGPMTAMRTAGFMPPESAPTRFVPAQSMPAQFTSEQFMSEHFGPTQSGSTQLGPAQAGPARLGPTQFAPTQFIPAQSAPARFASPAQPPAPTARTVPATVPAAAPTAPPAALPAALPAVPAAAPAPIPSPAAPTDDPFVLDRLAADLYDRLRSRLVDELYVGRERAQLLTDL